MRVFRLMLPRHKLTMHAYKRAYQRDNSGALCTVAGTIFHPAARQYVLRSIEWGVPMQRYAGSAPHHNWHSCFRNRM